MKNFVVSFAFLIFFSGCWTKERPETNNSAPVLTFYVADKKQAEGDVAFSHPDDKSLKMYYSPSKHLKDVRVESASHGVCGGNTCYVSVRFDKTTREQMKALAEANPSPYYAVYLGEEVFTVLNQKVFDELGQSGVCDTFTHGSDHKEQEKIAKRLVGK